MLPPMYNIINARTFIRLFLRNYMHNFCICFAFFILSFVLILLLSKVKTSSLIILNVFNTLWCRYTRLSSFKIIITTMIIIIVLISLFFVSVFSYYYLCCFVTPIMSTFAKCVNILMQKYLG